MKLFRRSKTAQPNVPPEVAEYYQAERRDRKSVTWIMTIITLLATVAVVIGLFLAGRWLYNTLRNRQPAPAQPTTSENQPSNTDNGSNTNNVPSDVPSQSEEGSPEPTDSSESSDRSSAAEDTDDQEDTPASSDSGNDSSRRSASQPSSGAATSGEALTNTGPGDTALMVFVATTAIAYVGYRLKLAKQ